MEDEILTLLSNSYESSNETRKTSIIRLFQYIENELEQFLTAIVNILQSKTDTKFIFLSLALIRRIYQHYDQECVDILIQNSESLVQACISLLQSEVSAQSGATMAEIIIFLSDFEINVNQIIQLLTENLQTNSVKVGIFEFFIIICTEIDLDPEIYFSLISYVIDPQFLSIDSQNDVINGIQMLSHIILEKCQLIDSNLLANIINFLLSALSVNEYKSSVYFCFAILAKECALSQQIILDHSFYEELMNDLSNCICLSEIYYFLRKSIKNSSLIPSDSPTFYTNILSLLYSISTSHQKVEIEVGIDEDYDNDSIAFSVIDQLISTHKNGLLPVIKPYLIFNSEIPQIREIGIKILNSIIINCKLEEQELLDFLEIIFTHINDPSFRVKEVSLWALHAFCYQKVLPLEIVKEFYEKEDLSFIESLLSFFGEIDDNNSSILAAISCEILSLFAIKNIDRCFQAIFDILFRFIFDSESHKTNSNSNLAFVQIRIEKVLLKMCSNSFDDEDLILYVLSTFSTCLSQLLHLDLKKSEQLIDFHNFLCEMIDQFLQNNILCLSSFDLDHFQDLITNLINGLMEFVTGNSISALTSLFTSFGDYISSNLNVLYQLFESYQNESIDSIIRYSINQSNFLLIEQFWEIIEDKHNMFFVPLINSIKNEEVALNESHIQIFENLFDPLFLNDFLIILEIIISNNDNAENWIELGFRILNSLKQQQDQNENGDHKIEEIFQQNINLIIKFFQSAEASNNIELCRKLFVDYDLLYILDYAMTDPEVALESESVLIVLNEVM